LELHHVLVLALNRVAGRQHLRVEARGHLHDLVHVFSMEGALDVGQAVKHLNRALAVADVEDFVDAGLLLDHADIGRVVVKAHVGPGVHPEVFVVLRAQRLVLLGVVRAAVVTDPHIVTLVNEK